MKAMRWSILVLVLSGLVLLNAGLSLARGQSVQATAPERAAATYRMDGVAVGEVSGGIGSSAHYRLSATIGQMGVGTGGASAHYALCVGLQCASANNYKVYLPLVLK